MFGIYQKFTRYIPSISSPLDIPGISKDIPGIYQGSQAGSDVLDIYLVICVKYLGCINF
jgi:hypothetical protein